MTYMNILIDMGNVVALQVDVIPAITAETGISQERIEQFGGIDFDKLSIGAMEPEEFWNGFNRHFGTSVERDLIEQCFHPVLDAAMVQLIGELKDSGHRVVCATNTLDSHYRIHRRRGDYLIFDAVYASHVMGLMKPDVEFFTHILKQESWEAGEVLYIDDRPEHIRSAKSIGIRGHVYTDAGTCRQWIASMLPEFPGT